MACNIKRCGYYFASKTAIRTNRNKYWDFDNLTCFLDNIMHLSAGKIKHQVISRFVYIVKGCIFYSHGFTEKVLKLGVLISIWILFIVFLKQEDPGSALSGELTKIIFQIFLKIFCAYIGLEFTMIGSHYLYKVCIFQSQ